jgi:hypothetical protein
MKLKQNVWYKATLTYPTPRTVYTRQVIDAGREGELIMRIEKGFCNFYDGSPLCIYSCTPATAKRKFTFTEI